MSLLDKATWKQKFSDFINRVSPFDGNPLIQKVEHQELVQDDLGDSTIFRQPSISAINSPSAAFGVDFANADRFDIDTSGSGNSAFTITLAGLNDNETGILNIVKKAGDTFSFANGLITPFNNTEGQAGINSIVMFVKVVAGSYVVQSGYSSKLTDWQNLTISAGVTIISGQTPQYRVNTIGNIELRGIVNFSLGTIARVFDAGSIPSNFTIGTTTIAIPISGPPLAAISTRPPFLRVNSDGSGDVVSSINIGVLNSACFSGITWAETI